MFKSLCKSKSSIKLINNELSFPKKDFELKRDHLCK